MTITWGAVNKPGVKDVLVYIYKSQIPAVASYRVGRLCERIEKEMGKCHVEIMKLADKYALKKEDGTFDLKDSFYQFKDDAEMKKYEDEYVELMKTEFNEKVHKIPLSALTTIKLSAEQLNLISDLVENDVD